MDSIEEYRVAPSTYDFPKFYDLNRPNDYKVDILSRCRLAAKIVEAAANEGTIDFRFGIVVVGGGAAGVSAALKAIELGIPCKLITKSTYFFDPQRGCTTRFLHPHQYEWPAPHYHRNALKPVSRHCLAWKATMAHLVAAQWQRCLDDAKGQTPRLESIVSTPIPVSPQGFAALSDPSLNQFGMIFYCLGFEEKVCIDKDGDHGPTFQGVRFWDRDQLEKPRLGYKKRSHIRILLAGAGDGCLQDFLRITFPGSPPCVLMQRLDKLFGDAGGRPKAAWRKAKRGISELVGKELSYRELHDEFDQITTNLADVKKIDWSVFVSKLKPRKKGSYALTLACSSDHFKQVYPLNRFLVLLLAKILKQQEYEVRLCPKTSIRNVVKKAKKTWKAHFDPDDAGIDGEQFDLVVPRLGIDARRATNNPKL